QLGTIGENIAYKNPKTEVYFEGMLENDCSGTLLFQQKAEFAGNPHTNIELVPEVGIVEERSGINAADAMRNVLRLEKVNGKKLAPYLRQICKGIVEPDEVGAVTNAGQPADEFLAVEPRIGTTTAKGEAPAVETLKAPATSETTAEFHPVKKGETLYRISKKYNVTVDQLKTWNNKGNSNTILVGEKLRVAPQSQVQERTAPAEGQIRILGGPIGFDNTGTTPSQPSAVPSLSAKGGGGGGSSDQYHVVKPGETVASIAMRYGYTEQHFREFNNLGRNDVAKIGQTLKTTDCDCPQMQPAAPAIGQKSAAGAESGLSSYAATQPRISTQYYNQQNSSAGSSPTLSSATTTPAPEESFYNQDLGRSSSYSTQEYDNLNTPLFLDRPSAPPPPPAVAQPATPANTQGREYSPQGDFYSITGGRIDSGNTDNSNLTSKGIISSSFSSRSPVVSGVVQENRSTAKTNQSRSFYVVKEGDTLFSIARRYGMTVERLRDINNLGGSEVIIPYQKLYLN
ncbi:MAG: LysM peptidoglycan-binding domain-containing protein, partial [Phaeodactylibacter sp.]|nr:LysM peptidoglycan-binding domain-containing protein [Phaeodactylibacter sp.]